MLGIQERKNDPVFCPLVADVDKGKHMGINNTQDPGGPARCMLVGVGVGVHQLILLGKLMSRSGFPGETRRESIPRPEKGC